MGIGSAFNIDAFEISAGEMGEIVAFHDGTKFMGVGWLGSYQQSGIGLSGPILSPESA